MWSSIFNMKACNSVVFNIECKNLRLCGFRRHEFYILIFNVWWKTYWHLMFYGKLTGIVCIVENLLTSCVLWKNY